MYNALFSSPGMSVVLASAVHEALTYAGLKALQPTPKRFPQVQFDCTFSRPVLQLNGPCGPCGPGSR